MWSLLAQFEFCTKLGKEGIKPKVKQKIGFSPLVRGFDISEADHGLLMVGYLILVAHVTLGALFRSCVVYVNRKFHGLFILYGMFFPNPIGIAFPWNRGKFSSIL